MTKVLFVGNCQAEALYGAYKAWIAPNRGEIVDYVAAYEEASEAAHDKLRRADIIALQVTDSEQEVSLTKMQITARVVLFPMVTAHFIWPFSGGAHPRDADIPAGFHKVFTGVFGDKWLDRHLAHEHDPRSLAAQYRDADIVSDARLERLVELVTLRQEERDSRADMSVGKYIMSNIAEKRMFLQAHHPDLDLFVYMLREVFERLGCKANEIAHAVSHYRYSPFPSEEPPIHPRIAEYLGLRWVKPDLKYRFAFGELVTWDQFIDRYVEHEWNEPLQRCLSMAYQNRPAAELELLESELESTAARYDSAHGYFALADTRQKLGKQEAALQAIQQALAIDPTYLASAVRHAEILLATGRIEDALAAAQDVVIWQPAYAPARIALFEAYDRLGRVEEALNEARAAFAVAPDHPHVRLRLAEIEKKANQSMMT